MRVTPEEKFRAAVREALASPHLTRSELREMVDEVAATVGWEELRGHWARARKAEGDR